MISKEKYIKDRFQNQLDWYNRKANKNRRIYQFLRVLSMICAISLPFLSGYLDDTHPYIKISIGIIGVIIALSEGILNLFKCHDNWVNYRSTSGSLQREKALFDTESAAYLNLDEKQAFRLFVNNIEQILSSESNTWKANMDEDETKN
jgi:hypothetical protein